MKCAIPGARVDVPADQGCVDMYKKRCSDASAVRNANAEEAPKCSKDVSYEQCKAKINGPSGGGTGPNR